jgi:PKD repeat protein
MGQLAATVQLGVIVVSSFITTPDESYFTVNTKKGTAPLAIVFNNTELIDSKLGSKFIWDFGNGDTLTTTSATTAYTYKVAGTYKAKLKYLAKTTDPVTSAKDGGAATIEVLSPVNATPVAKLTCTIPSATQLSCAATGSSDSDGKIMSYKYEWGDGSSQTGIAAGVIVHTYASSGSKTVKLTVTDDRGGQGTATGTYELKTNTSPVANFTCSKTGILKIHCDNTSTDKEDVLSNFAWTLDDGTTYGTSSFDHTFNKRASDVNVSNHNVTLKVTDPAGLTNSITKNVAVDLEPLKSKPAGFFRTYIDGTSLNFHSYVEKTQFDIKRAYYTIQSLPDLSVVKTVEINEFYADTITHADIGNYGNYQVTMSVVDMRDQVYQTQYTVPLVADITKLGPYIGFMPPVQSAVRTIYLNLTPTFMFDESMTMNNIVLDFGDGTTKTVHFKREYFITHTYASAGTYNVKITATTYGNGTTTRVVPVTVTDDNLEAVAPYADFFHLIYSYAQNVIFTVDTSGTPNGEIISAIWDFGDGYTGEGISPIHFYDTVGTYLVSLTVTDTAGLRKTVTKKIVVSTAGDDIVANIDCSGNVPYVEYAQYCGFTALDKFNEITNVRILWGDGSPWEDGEMLDGEYIGYSMKRFDAPGTYQVKLAVSTARGKIKYSDTTLTLTNRPHTADLQCEVNNLMVYCNTLWTDLYYYPLTYTFNYQDGFVETNESGFSNHAYANPGLYTVSVEIKDAYGVLDKATAMVQAVKPPNQMPVPIFHCDTDGAPLSIYCWDDGSYDPDGTVVVRKLSYDDGGSDSMSPPDYTRHVFATSGEHVVTLTVTDNDGGVSSLSKTFVIRENNAPVANFECYTPQVQAFDCYAYMSSDPDVGDMIISYKWEMGDEKEATQNLFPNLINYQYDSAGSRKIKLTVTDQYGKSASLEKEYVLRENQAPVANINCFVTVGTTYQCNNNSYDTDGQIVSNLWTVDGKTFEGNSIVYNFTNGGTYNIALVVKDNMGKTSSTNYSVVINKSIANFVCEEKTPYNISCRYVKPEEETKEILGMNYFIDDQDVYEQESFDHEFLFPGEHKIKLTTFDSEGGQAENEKTIFINAVYQLPRARFTPFAETEYKVRFDANESYKQMRKVVSFKWDFGDGTEVTTTAESEIIHSFPAKGYYNVTLTINDESGKTDIFTKSTYVYNPEVPNPGDAVNESLEGIDVDGDGIRDDVQRWINYEVKDNDDLKFVFRKLGANYQLQILNTDNSEEMVKYQKREINIQSCLYGKINNDDQSDYYVGILTYLYRSTEARSKAWSLVQSYHTGASSNIMSTEQQTRLIACQHMDE